jgi:uncharacterized protein (DUF2147 family)
VNKKIEAAKYYRKNREKLLEQKATYYQEHREKIVKQRATYRQKNREKIAKQLAARHQKNPEKFLKQRAKYCQEHREEIAAYRQKNRKKAAAYSAAYRQNNPEKIKANSRTMTQRHDIMSQRHKHQLAPRGIKGVPMSLKDHQKKLYFSDGRERLCWYCLGENNKTGSGLDRLDNDKTYTVKNTVPACRGCNVWRGSTHSVKETRANFKPMRDAALRKVKHE